jgi:acyl-CoA synthetase (AMP-forming)/AMP-acid ligase II
VANIIAWYQLSAGDVAYCVMPLFHIHGITASTLATLASGGTVVVQEGGFNALTFWRGAAEFGATWYSAVPTVHQMLLLRTGRETPAGAARMRFIRSSSSALSPATMAELEASFGAPVIEAYSMTEAAHQMTANPLPPGERRPGSVGVGAGVEVRCVDDEWNSVAPGTPGEVVVCGPNVVDGYENNPEANAASFRDGWFRTGDQGLLSEDGYLSLVGRLKEMINRGGEKIAPREVDEVLLQHPAVGEAVAFGAPHERWGEEVAAAVVLKGTVTEKELLGFCRERLADYKVPRRLFVVDQIPRTATGKIQRRTVATALLGS